MTASRDLLPGTLVVYPYLWKRQAAQGETEGRKDRPVSVLIAVRGARDDLTHLALLAISSQQPRDADTALEVPEIERRRGGLSEFKAAWITVDEYNYDIAEKSWYLDPHPHVLGRFSKSFTTRVAAACKHHFARKDVRVDRRKP